MKLIIASSFVLGSLTGLLLRDEYFFPTNLRIKRALVEHHLLTREPLN